MFANRDGPLDFSGAAQNDRIVVSFLHLFFGYRAGWNELPSNEHCAKEMEPCLRTTSINYIFFFICTPSHNFVFSCDVNIGVDLRTIEMH